jgi:predicted metal-binding membrane protein
MSMSVGPAAVDVRRRRAAGFAVAGLAAAGWLALAAWGASPYGRYLDHDGLMGSGLGGAAVVGLFLAGWVLMLVAMMLPSTLSLVGLFAGVVAPRSDRRQAVASLLGGYVVVWLGAGVTALAGDAVLHAVARRVAWVAQHHWAVAAAAVAVAGAYQFSALKGRCLEKCRSPRLLIFAVWRGQRPRAEAFRLGARHGRYCVGCCWALMLVMFAMGLGSLGWMLLLGAVMALEKNALWGPDLTLPLGGALLVAAAALVASGIL